MKERAWVLETFSEFLDLRGNAIFRSKLIMESEGNLNKVVEFESLNRAKKKLNSKLKNSENGS